MKLILPPVSLIVLVGISGSGKSTFARQHFIPTEIIDSDHMRARIVDDETNQDVTDDAFDLLHTIARKRLSYQRLTVIDATNVQQFGREQLLHIAQAHQVPAVAIILDVPENICWTRTQQRTDRDFGREVLIKQNHHLEQTLRLIHDEGFDTIYHLKGVSQIQAADVVRA